MTPTVGFLSGERAERARRLTDDLADASAALGTRIEFDADELVDMRSRLTGWRASGRTSAGGTCRLLACADGRWIALNLARPDDVAVMPIVVGVECDPDSLDWMSIEGAVTGLDADELRARATEIGVPLSVLGETPPPPCVDRIARRTVFGGAPIVESPNTLRVVDLSSLWAGPLVGHVLTRLGCHVTKVESIGRPDGARFGPRPFYERLHAGQESVVLDFGDEIDRVRLRGLLSEADVVVESSRARALQQLGVDVVDVMSNDRPRVWLSITAHGYSSSRVGFGDDAAVAGGLVDVHDGRPSFVGDAIADPLTGLVGAREVARALRSGEKVHVDLALASSAAWVAGTTR